MSDKSPQLQSKVTNLSKGRVSKAARGSMNGLIVPTGFDVEDEFKPLYSTTSDTGVRILEPPYSFFALERAAQENNALLPCIDAMIQNVDGTGAVIEKKNGKTGDETNDDKAKELGGWFEEAYVGLSFTKIRKMLRRDLERTGNAYLEVIRNIAGDLVFVRPLEAKMIRLIELDEAVQVERTVRRAGKDVTVNMLVRERRFVMRAGWGEQLVYFKQYGSKRLLDKVTGYWEGGSMNRTVDPSRSANELIHFTLDRDLRTAYGVPRWVNQTPSVVGSRLAEEHNLSFFNNGGIPPVLIMVQGGALAPDTVKALDNLLNGKTTNKHKAAILEAYSNSGDLNSNGSPVRVTVERFGNALSSDSMFETYDDKCEERVRRSYRLPPLFVGKVADFTFATAFASYTVAEAQVFKPEREEFDETVNMTIMRELDPSGEYVYRSLPLTAKDVTQQLEGIRLAHDAQGVDGEQVVKAVNEVTNLELKHSPPPQPLMEPGLGGLVPSSPIPPIKKPAPTTGAEIQKSEATPMRLAVFARDWAEALQKSDFATLGTLSLQMNEMADEDVTAIGRMIGVNRYVSQLQDADGMGLLDGCTAALLAAQGG